MNAIDEEWRPIAGFEGYYEVSSLGVVRSLARTVKGANGRQRRLKQKIKKPVITHDGYAQVTLSKNGKNVTRKVHRLVLEAFVEHRPDGLVACHGDGDKLNNSVANLRWDTIKNNTADSLRHGAMWFQRPPRLGEKSSIARTHCPKGHPYAGYNLIVINAAQGTRRFCRICKNEAWRKWWHRKQDGALTASAGSQL